MPSTTLPRLAALLLGLTPLACAAPAAEAPTSASELGATRRPTPLLEAWGGADASKWRSEAVVANAATRALNAAWRDPRTRDAVASVPLRMLGSELFPYGDGQSNAAPSLAGWSVSERPPVVATLIRREDGLRVFVRFDRALPIEGGEAQLRWKTGSGVASAPVSITAEENGDRVAEWVPAPELRLEDPVARAALAIVPGGWRAGFPIDFTHPVKAASSLRAAASTFADGRPLLDRERIGNRLTSGAPGTVAQRLREHAFAARFNNQAPGRIEPYATEDVHAFFPSEGRLVRTAVGGGLTWVADERPAGYKTMAQCFDPRRFADEAGVPSGSGFHSIGDRAETIVNDLEEAPMLVGFAARTPMARDDVGPDGFAWNLEDVATVRWLLPDEALVAPRGTFHAFLSAYSFSTCAEIVVSPETAPLSAYEP